MRCALLCLHDAIIHCFEDIGVFGSVILGPMIGGISGDAGVSGKRRAESAGADEKRTAAYCSVAMILAVSFVAMILGH